MVEVFKSILFGIIEGITEWLPISSTGHMLLLNEVLVFNQKKEFIDMYMVVIQLGAIFSVIVLFWQKICPFKIEERKVKIEKSIIVLWLKIIVSIIPILIFGLLFDDYVENNLYKPNIIALMLIFYGILFIVIERKNINPYVSSTSQITFKMALFIGFIQVLSIIPGTSRSGVTIIFALAIGISRTAASEYTFFLAIPTMLGASILKIYEFGLVFTNKEICLLLIGMITAFLVSILIIKFLMNFIKKHNFKIFGWYRIFLGIIILFTFLFI